MQVATTFASKNLDFYRLDSGFRYLSFPGNKSNLEIIAFNQTKKKKDYCLQTQAEQLKFISTNSCKVTQSTNSSTTVWILDNQSYTTSNQTHKHVC